MTSRTEFSAVKFNEICNLFSDNEKLFYGIAYHIKEKYLITHAGVTYTWYTNRCKFDENNIGNESLIDVCRHINDLWFSGNEGKDLFTFRRNSARLDEYYGDYQTHSPLWVRPLSLWEDNLFGFNGNRIQIVGHTVYIGNAFDNAYKNELNRIGTISTTKEPATSDEIDSGLYILDGFNKCKIEYNQSNNINIILIDCLRRETACVDVDAETLEWQKYKIE